MAPKKRKRASSDDDMVDEVEPEVEAVEVETEAPEPDEPDSGSSGVTFEMGKMYIAGVDDDEEDNSSDGPVDVSEYEEMDDSSDLKKARDIISGSNTDDDLGASTAEEDPYLEKANYDPSEEWALGD